MNYQLPHTNNSDIVSGSPSKKKLFDDGYKNSGALLSPDRMYRYALWRIWDDTRPLINFIGFNPSTADELIDDPTIRRCVGYAQSWVERRGVTDKEPNPPIEQSFGGIYMTNLFAYRHTHPKYLLKAQDPIGVENDIHLINIARKCNIVVFSWGNLLPKLKLMERDTAIISLFKKNFADPFNQTVKVNHLGKTKAGNPRHPLYLKKTERLQSFF